jgi:hypothetical protein
MPPAADQTNTVENELRVSKSLVAATLEKAKTYVFAETAIRDREVGGSNPLAPTIYFKLLRTAPAVRFQLLLWEFVAVLFID